MRRSASFHRSTREDTRARETARRAILSTTRYCQCGCGRRSDTLVTTGDGQVRVLAYLCAGLARSAPCTTG
jgi:hypothetical protein